MVSDRSESSSSTPGKPGSVENSSSKMSESNLTSTSNSSGESSMFYQDFWLRCMKYCVGLTLILSALSSSLMVYYITKDAEQDHFQGRFQVLADELGRLSVHKVEDLYNELRELSTATTSLTHSQDTEWPQVTIPFFQQQGEAFRDVSHTKVLILTPTVYHAGAWEQYAATNRDWLNEKHDEFNTTALSFVLHNGDGEVVGSSEEGPFNPVWEISPIPTGDDINLLNLDLRSLPEFQHAVDTSQIYNEVIVSECLLDITKRLHVDSLPDVIPSHPHSLVVQPIHETLALQDAGKIVGYFVSILTWERFLGNILHDQDALVAVIDNTCGEAYTYSIVGPNAEYSGAGDLHDRSYDNYEVASPLANVNLQVPTTAQDSRMMQDGNESPDVCVYTLHVYPTRVFHETFLSHQPLFFALACIAVFAFTAFTFVMWDYAVAVRQRKLAFRVKKTTKIVSSMFPKTIRKQLMAQVKEDIKSSEPYTKTNRKTIVGRYRDLLEDDPVAASVSTVTGNATSKPLADLYVATTIMFADICGFTAWSSVREPTQVFQLLEAIFSSFDEIARKMKVFKVETVGDCYVAVAGLPEPREDHAVLMAKFAQKCQMKVQELMESLVTKLGPDTAELALRCGLHSGPVTAGVLRGERSRLQLFGDTMNTTSRIETSGLPRMIHVSPETAELIRQGGKENWLEPREDLVVAKGKGALQTYWVKVNPRKKSAETAVSDNSESAAVEAAPQKEQDPEVKKMQRLIEWNCDILFKLLEKIVDKRQASVDKFSLDKCDSAKLNEAEAMIGVGKSDVVNEIAEIIIMPQVTSILPNDQEGVKHKAQVDPKAKDELYKLVSIFAELYRNNPFHCFEHASHVTMSVTKLLSRISKSASGDEGEQDMTYGITSDPLTQFSLVMAALIHDVDHRGVPNFVLIKEDPILARVYSNKSVAEQNSVDLAWNIFMDPAFATLRACLFETDKDLLRLRQLIVNSVMATDIFDKELGELRKKRWADAFHRNVEEHQDGPVESELTQVHRKATIVIEHLIQASDVSHTMQHWHVYQKWNERLFAEMYQGYLEGRLEKDPSLNWYQGELGFFDNYIIPLTQKLKECGVFGVSSDEYLNYATSNRNEWEKKGEEVVEKFRSKYASS